MRRIGLSLASLAVILMAAVVPFAIAQQQGPGAAVTQTGTRADAALICSSSASGTAVNTLTIATPGAALSTYLTYIGNWGAISGSVVATLPTALSTTGLNGTTPAFMPVNTSGAGGTLFTGGLGGSGMVFNPPIKGASQTAITLTAGAQVAGVLSLVQACYYTAP